MLDVCHAQDFKGAKTLSVSESTRVKLAAGFRVSSVLLAASRSLRFRASQARAWDSCSSCTRCMSKDGPMLLAGLFLSLEGGRLSLPFICILQQSEYER